jgi:integrase
MGPHHHNRLTLQFVKTVKDKGMYPDGGGLYLQVGDGGKGKSWLFRYHIKGRGERKMGLGSADTIGLTEVRERARKCRLMRLDGIDPIDARNDERLTQQLDAGKRVTLGFCAEGWSNLQNWRPSTRERAKHVLGIFLPKLGKIPVGQINVDLVEDAIEEAWLSMHRSARYALQYLENILHWAKAKGYRKGDNPASLNGELGIRLKRIEYAPKHYASLPYQQMGEFMARLRAQSQAADQKTFGRGLSSYVLEFVILTAVRAGQALALQWDEIDWDRRLWTCPEERTKGGKGITHGPHKIPLSKPAIAILEAMRARQKASGTTGPYVFTHGEAALYGTKERGKTKYAASKLKYGGKRMYRPDTMREYLQEGLKRPDLTVHGFRSTFKTWSVEHGYSEVLSEMALHHRVGNQVRNIYARGVELIEPRRQMMEAWAEYCGRTLPLPGEVVPLRKAK